MYLKFNELNHSTTTSCVNVILSTRKTSTGARNELAAEKNRTVSSVWISMAKPY